MKKFTKRALSLLLALVLTLSVVPGSVLAATGDLATSKDESGLVSGINTQDSISWPIKIYDYMNDGMLFEYNASGSTNQYANNAFEKHSLYAGGELMPDQNVLGNDYTVNDGKYLKAGTGTTGTGINSSNGRPLLTTYNTVNWGGYHKSTFAYWWQDTDSPFETSASILEAGSQTPGAFKYMHLQLKSGSTLKPWAINDFQTEGATVTDTSKATYAVIVYRTDIDTPNITLGFATGYAGLHSVGSGAYLAYSYFKASPVALETSETTWKYAIIPMFTNEIAANPTKINQIRAVIFELDKMASGQFFDISHIAYFADMDEATLYAKDAAKFSNDPGEYLADQVETTTPYVPEDQPDPVDPPTGYSSYCVDMTKATNSTALANLYSDWTTNTNRYINATKKSEYGKYFYNMTDKGKTGRDVIRVLYSGDHGKSTGIPKSDANYVTIVYRTHGISSAKLGVYGIVVKEGETTGEFFNRTTWTGAATVDDADTDVTIPASENKWVSFTYDMSVIKNSDYSSNSNFYSNDTYPNLTYLYLLLPGFTSSSESMDLAYVDFFSSKTDADKFGELAAAYMNDTTVSTTTEPQTTTAPKHWNMGSNAGFTMLYPANGGGWSYNGTSSRGDVNNWANGYFDYQIGYYLGGTLYESWNTINRANAETKGYTVSDSIFLMHGYASNYDISQLNGSHADGHNIGYTLKNTAVSGTYTVGLLESSLITVSDRNKNNYKTLQYKNDTIDYIGQLLERTLVIPQKDVWGNYNYNFVKGTKSSLYQYDLDGDGTIESKQVDASGNVTQVEEIEIDLATALRACLGITFRSDMDKAATTPERGYAKDLSAEKRAKLIGTFQECKSEIDSCAAAAYFLLHNLFVDNSYNQVQDEYNYLVLSKATLTDTNEDGTNKTAYVFDAGFTTGDPSSKTSSTYLDSSEKGVIYDKEKGTISLHEDVKSKDWVYVGSGTTTRFPFLPVTDSTGDFEGESDTYFAEGTTNDVGIQNVGYTGNNFLYVLQANGEFVYHVDDNLFFDFAGDDDVYLFINGELVLDIGGAHSITTVKFSMNDYVDEARKVLVNNENLPGYYTGMSDSEFKALLDASSLDDATKAEYTRWYKLDLADGQSYAIDFYYMERHGTGANMRIATNIVMTDPSMQTEKTAYQNGEEIPYGGVADKDTLVEYSFSITNSGNNKLYDLSFTDSTIGVKLDKTNGLTVSGSAVKDQYGGTLDISDLVINISGYSGPNFSGPVSVKVELDNATDLKKFMEDLTAPGTQTNTTSNLYAGSGLWKDGTLTIRGIYVDLNKVTITNDQFSNTVETTAATAIDSSTLLNGKDTHMLRTLSGTIQFYQWAGHQIGIHREYVFPQMSSDFRNNYTQSTFIMYPCLANGNDYTWPNVEVRTTLMLANFQIPGKYVIYIKLFKNVLNNSSNVPDVREDDDTSNDNDYIAIVPVVFYVTNVEDSTIVLDYGLKAELTGSGGIYTNDYLTGSATSTHKIMGISTTEPAYIPYNYNGSYKLKNDNRIDFTPATGAISSGNLTPQDETLPAAANFDGSYSVSDGKLFFTPSDFMDDLYTIYAAVSVYETDVDGIPHAVAPAETEDNTLYDIDISKEVQMYQKVTVLPASVVYYEDDFPAIEYADEEGNSLTTTNTFARVGKSDELTQSNSQSTPYGSDPYYKKNTNNEMSGGTLTTVTINDNQPFARFAFTGTGFELIGRTNATDAGTMEIRIYEDADGDGVADGEAIKCLPVITEFDNIKTGANGGDEVIYQVPVIRVDDLEQGKYIAVISGVPIRAGDPSTWKSEQGLTFTEITQACAAHAEGKLAWKYLNEWKNAGKLTEEQFNALNSVTGSTRVQQALALVLPEPDDSKLYIDGLRIFHPLGLTNEHYRGDENGATIVEVRQLITEGKVAFIQYDKTNGTAISTAFSTWSENRDGYVESQGEAYYDGHNVKSLNDYISDGPNNEVYVRFAANGTERQALVFYVTENEGAADKTLQIAARAVDRELFKGEAFGTLAVNLRYALGAEYLGGSDMDGAFLECGTIATATEQYYTIDYTKCPYEDVEQEDGTTQRIYEVVITGSNDIASFTSLKYNGLTVQTTNSHSNIENLTLKFENGILVEKNVETGEASSASYYQTRFNYLSELMSAEPEAEAPEAETPETPAAPTEPVAPTQPMVPELPVLAAPAPAADFPVATVLLGLLAIAAILLLAKKYRLF